MSESGNDLFQTSFSSSSKVDFQSSRMTMDGGLILVRELDEHLGFGELIERHLADGRGKNIQFPFSDLLQPSVYSRLADYGELNDAARLTQDPTLRLIGSKKSCERGPTLFSRLQSFETTLLTQADKLPRLATLYPGRAPPASAQR